MKIKISSYEVIGDGNNCRVCSNYMERRRRIVAPKRLKNRNKKRKIGFFTQWDYCTKCKRVQHYEKFRSKNREGFKEKKVQIFKDYASYIASKAWKLRKDAYFRNHQKICTVCRATKYIQLHHNKYNRARFGREADNDLAPLCRKCHGDFHEEYGVKGNMLNEFQVFMWDYIHSQESDWIKEL